MIRLLNILSALRKVVTMCRHELKAIDKSIAYYMADTGLTREQVAKQLGMSANTLRWKRAGESDWSWSEILTLSELTGKTPDELADIQTVSI